MPACIQFVSDQRPSDQRLLRASLRSARRTRGRLTGQSNKLLFVDIDTISITGFNKNTDEIPNYHTGDYRIVSGDKKRV